MELIPDVIERDGRWAVLLAGEVVTSPGGRELDHANRRLMEHVCRELAWAPCRSLRHTPAYFLLSSWVDLANGGGHPLRHVNEERLRADPFLQRLSSGAPSVHDPAAYIDILDRYGGAMSLIFGGAEGVRTGVQAMLFGEGRRVVGEASRRVETLTARMRELLADLSPPNAAAVVLLAAAHGGGLCLPAAVITGRISSMEYSDALAGLRLLASPSGTTLDAFRALLPAEYAHGFELPASDEPRAWCDEVRRQAVGLLDVLALFSRVFDEPRTATELIGCGEGDRVEFKSTLRVNLHTGQKDTAIEHAVLKTVAAFLNTSGGVLLVGVGDTGDVLGTSSDGFPDSDRYALHFWNLLKSSVGQDVGPSVRTSFEEIEGRAVFVVRCARSPRPVFLSQKGFGEEFFIRLGPQTEKLSIQEAIAYIGHRFASAAP